MALDQVGEGGVLFAEPVGGGFSAGAGVGEDEGGAVGLDEPCEFTDEAGAAEAGGRIRFALERGVDAEIDPLGGGHFDDTGRPTRPGKVGGDLGGWGDRRGQPDALRAVTTEVGEAFEAEAQVGAALVLGEGVDFIDDDPADLCEVFVPAGLAEEQAKALRRGEEDVRRVLELLSSFPGLGVARASSDADG